MHQESRNVVWISHKDAKCNWCGAGLGPGKLIVIDRTQGVRCLKCVGLAGLEFLPSGNVALTRRALANSSRSAIVVRFSRARKRNERQGVLVEETAIEQAETENAEDEARRETQRRRRRARDEVAERRYAANFTAKVLALFPGAPPEAAEVIAARACEKYSGRVGRSAPAKALDEEAVTLAVWAHVRHAFTEYDRLLAEGLDPIDARAIVRPAIERLVARWREGRRDEKGEAKASATRRATSLATAGTIRSKATKKVKQRKLVRPSRKRRRLSRLDDRGR
jgi:hypothetical protein